LQNDRYEISNVFFNESDSIQVSFKENEEYHMGNNKSNVIIASFVTASARIYLYEELAKLGDRLLYFDTGIF
jgi:hypothetical protein